MFSKFAMSVAGMPGVTVPWEQILAIIVTLLDGCQPSADYMEDLLNDLSYGQRARLRVACFKAYGYKQGEKVAQAVIKRLPDEVASARESFAGQGSLEESLLAELEMYNG